MSDQNPGSAAPGWYPDPQNPGQQRYWDGSQWSSAAPSVPATPAAPTSAAPPTSTNATVGLVLAIVSWFICPIIAAIAALLFARSSTKEIAASGGRVGGAGLNTATRIIAWINIGVYIVVGVIMIFLAVLGVGLFAQVASTVNPEINAQTGLVDGEYVMETNASLVIDDECTFGGDVYDMNQNLVGNAEVYGAGPACSLGTQTDLVYFVVTGGTAQILDVN